MAKGISRSTAFLGLLVVLLAAALGYFYTAYMDLKADYEELRQEYFYLLNQNATVIIINNQSYYEIALKLVKKANVSIYVIMYVLKYDPGDKADPANELVWALGNASARGVEVAVILEGSVAVNQAAYNYFRAVGVNVTYDSTHVTTHCKLMIIDHRYVLVGSHNWTESALWYNNEASVLIISEEVAKREEEYFNRLWEEAQGP